MKKFTSGGDENEDDTIVSSGLFNEMQDLIYHL